MQLHHALIEKANDGTLLLDEIGDLTDSSQIKLLRLLEEREYFPLGSDFDRLANVRILVTTHKDIEKLREAGTFRGDLYYRLRNHHLHIPPLRERKKDIPLLLDHFLEEAAKEFGKKKPLYKNELKSYQQAFFLSIYLGLE